nr:uncharacterized protein K02A2.6-like [Arachis hypogaea]
MEIEELYQARKSEKIHSNGDKDKARNNKKAFKLTPRYDSYTQFNTKRDEIIKEILNSKLIKSLWKVDNYQDTKNVDKSKYCTFHQKHGHTTDECVIAKDLLERLAWYNFKLALNPSARPIAQKKRNLGTEKKQASLEETKNLINAGFIQEIRFTTWLANVVMVKKHNGYKTLSFMDAYSGYNHILMHPSDENKIAFIIEYGNYCYKVMPFGLKNAGATYQRLMDKVFANQIGRNMEVYVDDMVAKTKLSNKHVDDLTEIFNQIRRYNMQLNPEKCAFGVQGGKFLGFLLTNRGMEANPDNCRAVLDITSP